MGIRCHYFLTLLPTYSWLSYGNFCLHCTVVETVKETKDDKQGHELSSNLLLVECVSETGEKPGCLEVDKQISVIVGGTRFVLESYGVRVDSLGDRRKHHYLPHCLLQHVQLSVLCSLSANLSLLWCFR